MSNEHYLNNPLTHQDRRLGQSDSTWVRSFSCEDIRPLIICRGPIRKEAMDVFAEMGVTHCGILLSEKDSIVYQNALAPELRQINNPDRIHRVPDYSGADKEERVQRIEQIIRIAKENNYNAIFAGYGFMAEDEAMVGAMEEAGLNFIGPCSETVHKAGLKDEAKRTALQVGVSVTPGINNATALTLLKKHSDEKALLSLVKKEGLALNQKRFENADSIEDKADVVLDAGYKKGIDLYSVAELQETVREQVIKIGQEYPENRIRLKCIGGGGGKGQRILSSPSSFKGSIEERLSQAADEAPSLVLEILNEVKATGQGDNKNILVELNIETTRHQEIQVIGNGEWALALGGRDCSLQMHEQKLLEISVTTEDLQHALTESLHRGSEAESKILSQEIKTLQAMEKESEVFGQAVGLDNVSTFECIVDRDKHFFMEMNTRIQVEHRVTELCYSLKFVNPDNADDSFTVHSLVEAMVLLAAHGKRLPKPERVLRHNASVEARLNATNQALAPHAGGLIEHWSDSLDGEIRDDQGISLHNPDTDVFMSYHLAGAYDSNIALLLTVGNNRLESFEQMSEVLRRTKLEGKDLGTNLEFHYGLVNWIMGNNIHAKPTTQFIVPYLTAVGALKQQAQQYDLNQVYAEVCQANIASLKSKDDKTAMQSVLQRKHLLLTRPVEHLMLEPHLLSGWLAMHQTHFSVDKKGKVSWIENPIKVLDETYHFLNMDFHPGNKRENPAATMIWDHDQEILSDALSFYSTLEEKLDICNFNDLDKALKAAKHSDFDTATWAAIKAAHAGYQAGCRVLLLLPYIAAKTGFFELKVADDLSLVIPENLTNKDYQEAMAKVLVPPPVAKSDEILASSGGMFYSREAPDMPPFIEEGQHFETGDPLYIVEVMKMFNKIAAPFSGTIAKVLLEDDGTIIKKGQPLFKIVPDEEIVIETDEQIKDRQTKACTEFLANI
ncbi:MULTISPECIES: biotin/lipoyl-containing protein [unclassified Oleiphilus]|uniref:ATP-binding protein n=6 Tax=Oleiphilus TaxID=141450 RepID=UPI0007C35DD9|nr:MULTISPECIES: biotin/lipoyl-containing protein [unclassified Oleiphilus]KZY41724.1 biotin carboxylase [Oleiphilus sp. HI0050]KZZ35857.1 biotin carboxylase [Oleiphilus sp. HI0086]KZZ37174.1 biotin carboxylase [Oleiphilus sp. HI0117]